MRNTPYDIPSLAEGSIEETDAIAGSIANELNRLLLIIRNCGQFLRAEVSDSGPSRVYLVELLAAAERATRIAAQLHAMAQSHVHREPSPEPRLTVSRAAIKEIRDAESFPRPLGASPKP